MNLSVKNQNNSKNRQIYQIKRLNKERCNRLMLLVWSQNSIHSTSLQRFQQISLKKFWLKRLQQFKMKNKSHRVHHLTFNKWDALPILIALSKKEKLSDPNKDTMKWVNRKFQKSISNKLKLLTRLKSLKNFNQNKTHFKFKQNKWKILSLANKQS